MGEVTAGPSGAAFGDPLAGTPYRRERTLGNGAFGEVILARDERTGDHVAVKVLLHRHDAPEARMRFLNEQQLDLRHPNLVSHRYWSQDRDRSILVMDHANGGDLGAWLAHHDRLASDTALDVARQVLAGLAHLHDQGIVHRDLKPSNLLLHVDDGASSPTVRIGDFGAALLVNAPRLTAVPMPAGTAGYIAPEVLAGDDADERSDLFAAGVILAAVTDRCAAPDVSLAETIDRMIAVDPADRPRSAREALRGLVDRPVGPWPAGDLPTVAPLAERPRPAGVTSASVGEPAMDVAESAVPVIEAARRSPRSPAPSAPRRPSTSGRRAAAFAWVGGALILCAVYVAAIADPSPPRLDPVTLADGTGDTTAVDLAAPFRVAVDGAPPDSVSLEARFDVVGIPLGSSDAATVRVVGPVAEAELRAPSARFVARGPLRLHLVARAADGRVTGEWDATLRSAQAPFTTIADWVVVLAAAVVLSYGSSALRSLFVGPTRVGAIAGIIVAGASSGPVAAFGLWILAEREPTVAGLIGGSAVGAAAALGAALLAVGRRPRRPAPRTGSGTV